ncbi:hypothetical protein P3S68_011332 [Capsicum galapagoense]
MSSNPLFGGLKSTKSIFGKSSHIWIEGEGMLHAFYFTREKGRGTWNTFYNNKHVQTETFKMEIYRKKPGFLPAVVNGLHFECVEICWNVNGAWNRPFTSHPKKAPGTGELVTVGIYPRKPYFELGVISADGKKMIHKVDLKFNRCTLSHDIGVTERYNVIMDFRLTIDINRLIRGDSLIKHDKDRYARIGVMPRYGGANSIKWFDVQPCCVFHLINCFEDNDEVVVSGCRACESLLPRPGSTIYTVHQFIR